MTTVLIAKLTLINTAEEIHLLTPTTGPRGDLIFKDNEGSTFLAAGVLWRSNRVLAWRKGWPCGVESHLVMKRPCGCHSPMSSTAERRAQQATAELSALTGSPILIDLGEPA